MTGVRIAHRPLEGAVVADMMRATVVHTFGQVLAKIAASDVCHTDLHAANGDRAVKPTLPFNPGHAGVGTVAGVGRGDMAVQYTCAMGFHVIAADIADDKLALVRRLGAATTVNATQLDPAAVVQRELRGVHGVLVTTVSRAAFAQAVGMLHKLGTMLLVGLQPGGFELPVFDVALNAKTGRGSIVGTREDLEKALAVAAEGAVRAQDGTAWLDQAGAVFERMKQGAIDGRVVPALWPNHCTDDVVV